uniref:Uncharacterized protein n=1 Tax=Arundo donax TaxID=35708 RepID=A0A0A8ZDE0_ARUDO
MRAPSFAPISKCSPPQVSTMAHIIW